MVLYLDTDEVGWLGRLGRSLLMLTGLGSDILCWGRKILITLPIALTVFMVHLATIPITGTRINPARSFGAVVIYNQEKAWNDQWIFWVGPFVGAAIAAFNHQFILRAGAIKARGSFRSN